MNYLGSFIFYFIIILITIFLSALSIYNKNPKTRKVYKILCILIPAIVAGIRYDVGTDYLLYERGYHAILENSQVRHYVGFEPGYTFLNKLVGIFLGDFSFLMFFMSFFTIMYVYKALENEKDNIPLPLGMAIYMFLFYLTTLNLVRQSLAIALVLYAVTSLNKKSKIYCIFYILFASLFHTSSFIALPIILSKKVLNDYRKKYLQIFIMLTLLILISNLKLLGELVYIITKSNYYAGYFLRESNSGASLLNHLLKNAPLILIPIISLKNGKENKNFLFYFNLYMIGQIISLVKLYSGTNVQRLALYYTYFCIFLFPYSYKLIDKKYKKLLLYFILGVTIFIWYTDYFHNFYSEVIPYKTIFNKF